MFHTFWHYTPSWFTHHRFTFYHLVHGGSHTILYLSTPPQSQNKLTNIISTVYQYVSLNVPHYYLALLHLIVTTTSQPHCHTCHYLITTSPVPLPHQSHYLTSLTTSPLLYHNITSTSPLPHHCHHQYLYLTTILPQHHHYLITAFLSSSWPKPH